jgi:urea ABC transporter permease protein UrtB
MEWTFLLKQTLNGFSFVLFLILISLGLTLIFGIMRVINMAHGELMMIGAYTLYAATSVGLGFVGGLILAPVVAGGVGIIMERSVIRYLYQRRDLSTLLATWGFSIIFQQVTKLLFGPQPQFIPSPFPGSLHFLGITYPAYRLFSMIMCFIIIMGVIVLFFKSNFGVAARATIQNTETADVLGVNTKRMFLFTFGFGSALAGLSGALIAPLVGVIPTMGLDYIVRAFFVVIVGGMGSILGALGSGFVLGETESIITIISNATLAQILVFVIVIVLMLVKPKGLFSKKDVR